MDFSKTHFKFDGLNHNLAFEQDKIQNPFEQKSKEQQQIEEQKRKLQNQVFDPTHMEIDLPDVGDETVNNILDPDFMTFDF